MINESSQLSAFGRRDSPFDNSAYLMALDDFKSARRRAAMAHLLARLSGKSLELLSFGEVTQRLKETSRHDLGLQEIPVEAIVGSVSRTRDFDRDFSPLHERDAQRWARVKVASTGSRELPPIEVYKIGDSYFVSDGNHRVSIARQQGIETISARVIEVQTRAPLPAGAQPDDLIISAEYADFLEYTLLDKMRPEADLRVSVPGQYNKLENHIAVHRCYLEANDVRACRTLPEAARYWYDDTYFPVIETIRERGLLRDFPGWTETDLYLWVAENQEKLRDELGWSIDPESVISNLAGDIGRGSWSLHLRRPKENLNSPQPRNRKSRKSQNKWQQQRSLDRYSQFLFGDILVPVSENFVLIPGHQGPLRQALVVASLEGEERTEGDQEGPQLLGLAISEDGRPSDESAMEATREAFEKLCREAEVDGALDVVEGYALSKISEWGCLADLIVLDRRFLSTDPDPEKGALDMLRSIKRVERPVMLTGESTSLLKRILLVLDERPGIGTTLFLATYLAERWGSKLVVLSARRQKGDKGEDIDQVQQYLALHEVEAPILSAGKLDAATIVDTAIAQKNDLIVMNWPPTGRIIGRASGDIIELLLDRCQQPILICP